MLRLGPEAGGPAPLQAPPRPHLPAGAVLGPPPPHRGSSALEGDLGRVWRDRFSSRQSPEGLTPSLQLERGPTWQPPRPQGSAPAFAKRQPESEQRKREPGGQTEKAVMS